MNNKKEIVLESLEQVRLKLALLSGKYKAKIVASNLHIESDHTVYKFSLIDKPITKSVKPNCVSRMLNTKSNYHKIDLEDPYLKTKLGYCINELSKVEWKNVNKCFGYHEVNTDLVDTPLHVWCYDINSAYAFAMIQPMPDTRHPYYETVIKENQIGFDEKLNLVFTKPGIKCPYVFDLIESPFTEFVNYYYNLKKNATGKDRQIAKSNLCIASGIIALHNPFLRRMIIWYSNKYIKHFWDTDPNAVYCNVDSIYTTKPRNDLPMGNELGQFKLEHENVRFIYKGIMQYQIEDEVHKCGMSGLDDLYDEKPNLLYDIIWDNDKIINIERKKD